MPRTNTQQLPFAIRPITCRGIFVDVRTTAHTRDKTTLVRDLPAKPRLLALPLFHRPRITPSCALKRMVISTPNPMAEQSEYDTLSSVCIRNLARASGGTRQL